MLCGNKCDLRDECPEEGKKYVKTEDGQRLAKVKYHHMHHTNYQRQTLAQNSVQWIPY